MRCIELILDLFRIGPVDDLSPDTAAPSEENATIFPVASSVADRVAHCMSAHEATVREFMNFDRLDLYELISKFMPSVSDS